MTPEERAVIKAAVAWHHDEQMSFEEFSDACLNLTSAVAALEAAEQDGIDFPSPPLVMGTVEVIATAAEKVVPPSPNPSEREGAEQSRTQSSGPETTAAGDHPWAVEMAKTIAKRDATIARLTAENEKLFAIASPEWKDGLLSIGQKLGENERTIARLRAALTEAADNIDAYIARWRTINLVIVRDKARAAAAV